MPFQLCDLFRSTIIVEIHIISTGFFLLKKKRHCRVVSPYQFGVPFAQLNEYILVESVIIATAKLYYGMTPIERKLILHCLHQTLSRMLRHLGKRTPKPAELRFIMDASKLIKKMEQ
jgi:hypothetical protein